jgi:hypothetical protein
MCNSWKTPSTPNQPVEYQTKNYKCQKDGFGSFPISRYNTPRNQRKLGWCSIAVLFMEAIPLINTFYHNFAVNPEHRDFLRFLWFKDGDINQPIVEYHMNVHLFGAISSPCVGNFGLMATAKEGSQEFGENARDFLEQEFYVHDGLKSFANPEEAIATV